MGFTRSIVRVKFKLDLQPVAAVVLAHRCRCPDCSRVWFFMFDTASALSLCGMRCEMRERAPSTTSSAFETEKTHLPYTYPPRFALPPLHDS